LSNSNIDLDTHNDENNAFKSKAALMVSIFAMVLAVSNIGSSNASGEATEQNILASNVYSFFQAKNIRQTQFKLSADNLEISLANQDKLTPAAKAVVEKKIEAYKKTIERYESEPETGEGKKELLLKAKEHEKRRDKALLKDPWFDYAEGLLQVSIVLASVAIVTSTPVLLIGSMTLGVLGSIATLNGYYLFF
jgi:hypothetical protein